MIESFNISSLKIHSHCEPIEIMFLDQYCILHYVAINCNWSYTEGTVTINKIKKKEKEK